jgi:hypothetical protein
VTVPSSSTRSATYPNDHSRLPAASVTGSRCFATRASSIQATRHDTHDTCRAARRPAFLYRVYKDGIEEIGSLRAWGVDTVANDEIFQRDNGVDFGTGKVDDGAVILSMDVVGKNAPKPYTFVR